MPLFLLGRSLKRKEIIKEHFLFVNKIFKLLFLNIFLPFQYLKQHAIIMLLGVLAQLGAHHTGSVGVTGSSPVYSTKTIKDRAM